MLVASVVLLWIVVLVLAILVILLYRQFGLVYIGSRGRIAETGLPVGAQAPTPLLVEVNGQSKPWSWNGPNRVATAVVMTAPDCRVCEELIPELQSLARKWSTTLPILVVDRLNRSQSIATRTDLPLQRAWTYAADHDGRLHNSFDVVATPFAFVVDTEGRVRAKGLVNYASTIETMARSVLDSPESLAKEGGW